MKYIYLVGQQASNFHFSQFVNTIDNEFTNTVDFLLPIPPSGVRVTSNTQNQLVLQHVVVDNVPVEFKPILSKQIPLVEMCDALDDTYKYVIAAAIITNCQIQEPQLIATTQFLLYHAPTGRLVDFNTLSPVELSDNETLLPMFSVVRFGNSQTYAMITNTTVCAIPTNVDFKTDNLCVRTINQTDEPLCDEILSPMVHNALVVGNVIVASTQHFTIDFFSGINIKVDALEQQLRWDSANVSIKTNLDVVVDAHSIRVRPARGKIGYIQVRVNANEFFNAQNGIAGPLEYNKIIIQE